MPRIFSFVMFWIAGLLLGVESISAELPVFSENLLPNTTAGYVAVADVKELTEHWNKTQLGQLMADPVMEPFAKDLRRQIEDRWSWVHDRLGLTLDDIKDVPSGEVGVALVLPESDKGALAIVVDVTDHLPQAAKLLEKVSANLKRLGAKRTMLDVAESDEPVIFFDIPKPEDDPQGQPGKAYYFLSKNVLGASDNLGVLRVILSHLGGKQGDRLADVPALQAVRKRCAEDAADTRPQIRWFIHPLSYVEVVRSAIPKDERRKGKSVLEMLENQGVAAVRGVGGFVDFAVGGYELVHRTFVYAPPPYKKAMKMLAFPNHTEFTPQRWVPRDVATYTTLYCDLLNAFDNFGPLFDELLGDAAFLFSAELKCQQDLDAGKLPEAFGEEFEKLHVPLTEPLTISTKRKDSVWEIQNKRERKVELYTVRKRGKVLRVYEEQTGVWEEVLESLKTQEDGPQIDLREELVKHLGQRVTVITDYDLPITPTSERILGAVETSNVEAVKTALQKLMENDPSARRHEFDGQIIWEIVEEEEMDIPAVDVGAIPGLSPEEPPEEEDEGEDTARLLPHAAVTVAHGHLFVASDYAYLVKILEPAEQRETLGRSIDYRLVDGAVEKLGMEKKFARSFSRTDEEYRPTYELIRQGKMPLSETVTGRLLNAMFGEGKKGVVRQQKIDGTKLPDYDVVRRYLGPASTIIGSEADGWFFKGFMLSKESQ